MGEGTGLLPLKATWHPCRGQLWLLWLMCEVTSAPGGAALSLPHRHQLSYLGDVCCGWSHTSSTRTCSQNCSGNRVGLSQGVGENRMEGMQARGGCLGSLSEHDSSWCSSRGRRRK
jgi:hypothetical protein